MAKANPDLEEIIYQKYMIVTALIFAGERGLSTSTLSDLVGTGKDRRLRSIIMSLTNDEFALWEDDGRIGLLEHEISRWENGNPILIQ